MADPTCPRCGEILEPPWECSCQGRDARKQSAETHRPAPAARAAAASPPGRAEANAAYLEINSLRFPDRATLLNYVSSAGYDRQQLLATLEAHQVSCPARIRVVASMIGLPLAQKQNVRWAIPRIMEVLDKWQTHGVTPGPEYQVSERIRQQAKAGCNPNIRECHLQARAAKRDTEAKSKATPTKRSSPEVGRDQSMLPPQKMQSPSASESLVSLAIASTSNEDSQNSWRALWYDDNEEAPPTEAEQHCTVPVAIQAENHQTPIEAELLTGRAAVPTPTQPEIHSASPLEVTHPAPSIPENPSAIGSALDIGGDEQRRGTTQTPTPKPSAPRPAHLLSQSSLTMSSSLGGLNLDKPLAAVSQTKNNPTDDPPSKICACGYDGASGTYCEACGCPRNIAIQARAAGIPEGPSLDGTPVQGNPISAGVAPHLGPLLLTKSAVLTTSNSATLHVWTDGSCLNNGKWRALGGCGVFFSPNDPRNASFALDTPAQSNNLAEMRAAAYALEVTKGPITIHTDSEYLVALMQKRSRPSRNLDMYNRLLTASQNRRVQWVWVKSHTGLSSDDALGNDAADALARRGCCKHPKEVLTKLGYVIQPDGLALQDDPEFAAQQLASESQQLPEFTPTNYACCQTIPDGLNELWLSWIQRYIDRIVASHIAENNHDLDVAISGFFDLPGRKLSLGKRGGHHRKRRIRRALLDDDDHDHSMVSTSTVSKSVLPKAIALSREGCHGRAARMLYQSTTSAPYLAPDAPQIIGRLHPAEDLSSMYIPHAVVPELNLHKAIHAVAHKGVSPGPSGWTWELLRPMTETQLGKRALLIILQRFLAPDLPNSIRVRLCASRLFLSSSAEKIRPIAMGELFLKLLAHAVTIPISHRFADFFRDLQLGVQTKGGAEKIIHWAREQVREHSAILVTIDCANAFNTMSRESMRQGILGNPIFSPLSQLFNVAYAVPSPLIHDSGVYQSQSGARQGCVLGSLLFSIGLQSVIEKIALEFPSVQFRVYLDDFTFAILPSQVHHIENLMLRLSSLLESHCRLIMNPSKSKYLSELPIPSLHAMQHETDSIKVLGSYIGSATSCEKACVSKAASHEGFFKLLNNPALPSGVAFDILRVCGTPRMMHLARTLPPDISLSGMRNFDQMIRETFAKLMSVTHFPTASVEQFTLPIARGGLGLVPFTDIAPLAYTSSVEEYRPKPVLVEDRRSQAERSLIHHAEKVERIMAGDDKTLQARLHSCSGAASWVNNSGHIRCPEAWRLAMRLRLGLPLRHLEINHTCVCGRTLSQKELMDHILSCTKIVGFTRVHRHDVLQKTIQEVLSRHGLPTVPVNGAYHADSNCRPDFLVVTRSLTLSVDLSVTHPLSSSLLSRAAQHKGYSASQRESEKAVKHAAAATSHGHVFSPWVFETLGTPGGELMKSLHMLSGFVQRPQEFISEFLAKTATVLQVCNAELLQNALVQMEAKVPVVERPKWKVPSVKAQQRRMAERAPFREVEWLP